MGLPVTHVRLDPKFFASMRPGESATARLNQIISRYLSIIADESEFMLLPNWAAVDQWAAMREILRSLPKPGPDLRAHQDQFVVAINSHRDVHVLNYGLADRIDNLCLSEYITLLERLERVESAIVAEGGAS